MIFLAKLNTLPKTDNARLLAVWGLLQVQQKGQSLNTLLPIINEQLVSKNYAFSAECCYGVCRQYFFLEALLSLLLTKKLKHKDQDIQLILLLGLYQLTFMDVAPHAAISETVNLCRLVSKKWATKFTNAILRRFQREQKALLEQVEKSQGHWALPPWMISKIKSQWAGFDQQIAWSYRQKPPMNIRIDTTKISRDAYLNKLKEQGIEAKKSTLSPVGLSLAKPLPVNQLNGFSEGFCSVQDHGAQLAAILLNPQAGDRILDACAAPGGKSLHLLQMAKNNIKLTSIDNQLERLKLIEQNLTRANLNATVICADAANPQGKWSEQQYDRILLDVPCSASGVIRRHPDIKLLRKAEDIQPLVEIQAQILEQMWSLLKVGGHLLYVTCSIFETENEQQIKNFLTHHQNAQHLDLADNIGIKQSYGRQLLPLSADHDGFYFALLTKKQQL